MKKNEKFVITINRELGSGGRTIGEKVAKELNVAFYDKALIKALTKEFHLTVEEIEKLKGKKEGWWADFQRKVMPFYSTNQVQYYQVNNYDDPTLLTSEQVFQTETKILEDIASEESCVIAGRSGFFVFRNHPNHLSILIQSPIEKRIERVVKKQGVSPEEAKTIINKVDKARENYIKKYTGTSRYDTRNYDLVINMGKITEEEAIDIILSYIKNCNKK